VRDVLAARPGRPLKIRVQPMIFRHSTDRTGSGGQYHSWSQLRWTLECDTVQEAGTVREAMTSFFATLARFGPTVVLQALQAVNAVSAISAQAKGGQLR